MAWVLLVLLLASGEAQADRRPVSCAEASADAYRVIPWFFEHDEADSLDAFLDWWRRRCGDREPVVRSRILARIWEGRFDEELYDPRILDQLLVRRDLDRAARGEEVEVPWSALGEAQDPASWMDQEGMWDYDAFLRDVARQLQPHVPEGGLEDFFTRYYAGEHETAWTLLQGPSTEGTKLRRLYDAERDRLGRRLRLDLALGVEVWDPGGELARLGIHPGLGLVVGGRRGPWRLGVDAGLRFGRADRPYTVGIGPGAVTTGHFQWAQALALAGRRVGRIGPLTLEAVLGAGIAGLQYRPVAEFESDPPEAWIASFAWTTGIEVRLPGPGAFDLTLQVRREWVDLDTEGGSVLEGGAWNFRLGAGRALDTAGGDARRRALGLAER